MELLATYEKDGVTDKYNFVFNEVNPGGYYTMLAMSEDGHTFSNWTSGLYDPDGPNEHLGRRITLQQLGHVALDGFFSRLSIPRGWEPIHEVVEQIIREDDDE